MEYYKITSSLWPASCFVHVLASIRFDLTVLTDTQEKHRSTTNRPDKEKITLKFKKKRPSCNMKDARNKLFL